MTTGTEIVERGSGFSDLVRQGAGVDWPAARVAAINKLLPKDFQNDAASAIALAIRAKRSGLDPFTQIHAWKNERGTLQFQTSRDGFIEIASRDPAVESLEFQHVYEGESFSWRKDSDGKVNIAHEGGLKQGVLLGAYCCAHMAGDAADHLEMRLVDDYRHLFKKQNWTQYLPDMLITRVISATVRLVCPSSAGLYSAADFALNEADTSADIIQAAAIQTTEHQIDRIVGDLDAVLDEAEEIEAVEVESEPDPTPEPTPEPPQIESRHECVFCGDAFDTQQGLAGHGRKHPNERAALEYLQRAKYPFPTADVVSSGDEWLVTNVGTGEVWVGDNDIVKLAATVKETLKAQAEAAEEATSDEQVDDAEPAPSVSDIYAFVRKHPDMLTGDDVKASALDVGGDSNLFNFTPDQRRAVMADLQHLAEPSDVSA